MMKDGLSGRIARAFINSKLTPLLIAGFMAIGLYSIYLTPSEEEPQITVPMADIFVAYPGASPREIETKVTRPLEKIVSSIAGVEYVYSTSMPGQAMLIVRYYVGEDMERSLFKLYNEIQKNMDLMPRGMMPPFIKTKSIDDVPILALTLWSEGADDLAIRGVAAELAGELKQIADVAETRITGGRPRQVRVTLRREKLAAYNLDPLMVAGLLGAANRQAGAGRFSKADTEYLVETGNFLATAADVGEVVVGVRNGAPIRLRNVASVVDGYGEVTDYVRFGTGAGAGEGEQGIATPDGPGAPGQLDHPAVTVSISKRQGADARRIADEALLKVDALKGELIPSDVNVSVTRNYGETSSEKVSELLKHLSAAIVAVTILVTLAMGWRSGVVIFASVPVTFALTLFVYYLFGYTLNRITLFALVFVTGIVVDDSIIIVENMHRHFRMKRLPFLQAAIASIDEVGNPTILATFTVIAAVLPMAFVSGLMGPYMSPMPIGASMAMMFSLLVALIISPWLAFRLLKNDPHGQSEKPYSLEETPIYKWYSRAIVPLIESPKKRGIFLWGVAALLALSTLLLVFRLVPVKMLPFDNKNEFQVIVDMPEGTTLERTAAVTREIALYVREQPEVTDFQVYAGTAGPMNFNGLVRHYDLRRGPNVADIQVNLLPKGERDDQSHDIAKRIRPGVQEIARRHGARVKIAEVPPGPPVLSTLVAEVYGPEDSVRTEIARRVRTIFENTAGVVDVDWLVEEDQPKYSVEVIKEKAMLSGISTEQVNSAVGLALSGYPAGTLYQPRALEAVPVVLRLDEKERSGIDELLRTRVMSPSGAMIPVSELVRVRKTTEEKSIYRKNQQEVVYVTADVAGELESPVYAILDMEEEIAAIGPDGGYSVNQLYTAQPFIEKSYSMKWDGEWHITYEVFRDLGAAFMVVLLIIYLLIVGWFQSFKVPVVMMVAIPLSLVGILVGHWMMGAFFTATSMIGMIALAGIMVRNSVLLIDFIDLRLEQGVPLRQAIIESGAVRTTPILLTSGAVVIGAFVILFDPIFQGLAIALIGGSIASTALTLLIVPLIYYMTESRKGAKPAVPAAATTAGTGHAGSAGNSHSITE
jgi:multidrug efflux pump subunit AcrB